MLRIITRSLKFVWYPGLILGVMIGGMIIAPFAAAADVSIATSAIRPALTSTPDGTLYAAVENTTNGDLDIYLSINGGESWSRWLNMQHTGVTPHNPSLTYIEANGDKWLYIAYEAMASVNSRSVVVYRRSVVTGSDKRVTIGGSVYMPDGQHIAPEICTDYPLGSGYLYLTYAVEGTFYPVMFSRSTDFGDTWTVPANVTGAAADSTWQTTPDIAYGTAGLFLTFEKLGGGANQIWVRKSANSGGTWGDPVQLTTSASAEYHPRVSVASGNNAVLIAYTRDNSGDLDIGYVYSTDGGSTWSSPGSLSATAGVVEQAVELGRSPSGGNFQAAYWQAGTIMYRSAPITAPSSWSAATLINDGSAASSAYPRPAVAVTGSVAGIAWTDVRNSPRNDVYFDVYRFPENSYLLWTK